MALPDEPVWRTWATGDTLTGALANGQLRDNGRFLTGPPTAELVAGALQSIPNNVSTDLLFTAALFDNADGWSSITSPARYVAKRAGWYWVAVGTTWAANATGVRTLEIHVNGNRLQGRAASPGNATIAVEQTLVKQAPLDRGDFITATVIQTSGTPLSTTISGGNVGPFMSVAWHCGF